MSWIPWMHFQHIQCLAWQCWNLRLRAPNSIHWFPSVHPSFTLPRGDQGLPKRHLGFWANPLVVTRCAFPKSCHDIVHMHRQGSVITMTLPNLPWFWGESPKHPIIEYLWILTDPSSSIHENHRNNSLSFNITSIRQLNLSRLSFKTPLHPWKLPESNLNINHFFSGSTYILSLHLDGPSGNKLCNVPSVVNCSKPCSEEEIRSAALAQARQISRSPACLGAQEARNSPCGSTKSRNITIRVGQTCYVLPWLTFSEDSSPYLCKTRQHRLGSAHNYPSYWQVILNILRPNHAEHSINRSNSKLQINFYDLVLAGSSMFSPVTSESFLSCEVQVAAPAWLRPHWPWSHLLWKLEYRVNLFSLFVCP